MLRTIFFLVFAITTSSLAHPCDDLQHAASIGDLAKIKTYYAMCIRHPELYRSWNALHEAAFYGQLGAIKLLLELGMSPTEKDGNGWTPIYIAHTRGFYSISDFLFSLPNYQVSN